MTDEARTTTTEAAKLDPEKLRQSCEAHARSEEYLKQYIASRRDSDEKSHYLDLTVGARIEAEDLMAKADPELGAQVRETVESYRNERSRHLDLGVDNSLERNEAYDKMTAVNDRADALVKLRCGGPSS